MEQILRVENLCKKDILNNISFNVKSGEMVAIMGPSGSGKSTLLYNVSGMDKPDAGQVWLENTDITGLSEDEKAKLRLTKMGFVFQQMNVIANLNIVDNIIFPAVHVDRSKTGKKQALEKAKMLMEKFHIKELENRKVTEVSGGQLQRACICRSMMLDPQILFADEPTGALNRSAAQEVMDTFLNINNQGTTIMMVTHDSKVASKCERVLYIIDGEIKGELKLGKYEEEKSVERENETTEWLNKMGW